MEDPNGVTPASPAAPAPVQPTGSEAVINAGEGEEQFVPFNRFQEVNNTLKEERNKREELQQQFEQFQTRFTPKEADDQIDPEVKKVLDTYVKQNGFVSKTELEQVQREAELRAQVQSDITDLSQNLKGFEYSKVAAYAKENGNSINSKADMKAVYYAMNRDAEIEEAKKAAIADFQASGRSTAESTGSSAPAPSGNQQPQTLKQKIAAAAKKVGV